MLFAALHMSLPGITKLSGPRGALQTDVLCVPTNVCSWGKSGRAADITAKTDFDPNGLREHSRDLPIAALVTDVAMEAWYHPSIA
jgi:hypothetical protein